MQQYTVIYALRPLFFAHPIAAKIFVAYVTAPHLDVAFESCRRIAKRHDVGFAPEVHVDFQIVVACFGHIDRCALGNGVVAQDIIGVEGSAELKATLIGAHP